jgi:regulator of cell morphogenesis and NO signaling
MLDKVMSRHGERLPDLLPPLQRTFESLKAELLDHMAREDRILFPAIVAVEIAGASGASKAASLIAQAAALMEADHDAAGAALAHIRQLTGGFAPPDWACPTFRGLYYGLAQFESDMHLHVHLENNVLFPRAVASARGGTD